MTPVVPETAPLVGATRAGEHGLPGCVECVGKIYMITGTGGCDGRPGAVCLTDGSIGSGQTVALVARIQCHHSSVTSDGIHRPVGGVSKGGAVKC